MALKMLHFSNEKRIHKKMALLTNFQVSLIQNEAILFISKPRWITYLFIPRKLLLFS